MKSQNPRQEFAIRAASLRSSVADAGEEAHSLFDFVLDAAKELEEKQVALDAMFKLYDERGWGVIFMDKNRQYGFVLPDASQEGAFRYQLFDKKGFFFHSTHNTADEAILELCESGYCELVPEDTLDKLSQTRDWKFGTEALALRQAVESGVMTWKEGERQYADLQLKYDPDLWAA